MGSPLQRLYSTFADRWPGTGLLLLRLLAGAALIHHGMGGLREAQFAFMTPRIIGAGAGILLIGGLWTPVAGMLAAVGEAWIALSYRGDPWVSAMLAALGAALAMAGPGAWSIDARLFGRKHIELPER
jgi:putative oxidoreductase